MRSSAAGTVRWAYNSNRRKKSMRCVRGQVLAACKQVVTYVISWLPVH